MKQIIKRITAALLAVCCCTAQIGFTAAGAAPHSGGNGILNCKAAADEQLFRISEKGVLLKYKGEDPVVVVPDSVKEISTKAFYEPIPGAPSVYWQGPRTDITSVTLPVGLTTICNKAFNGCTGLTELIIPDTVTSIGAAAFQNTPWLEQQEGMVIVGDGIFCYYRGNNKIITIPDGVRKIAGGDKDAKMLDKGGALDSTKITEIRIPASVTEIQPLGINCKNAVIAGIPGSTAEEYAIANDLPFRDLTYQPQETDSMTVDFEKDGWAFGNFRSIFGSDYYLTETDRQRLTALEIGTEKLEEPWHGSCVGLSITMILMKNGLIPPERIQPGAETISDIIPDDTVRSLINYYQCTQTNGVNLESGETSSRTIYRMIRYAENIRYGGTPFLLTFATAKNSHGVVGCGLESGGWEYNGVNYDSRILVWDPNFPGTLNDDSCVYFDSQTLDYCIPHYGVHVSDGDLNSTAGIITVCDDLAALNANPHPLALNYLPGDADADGQANVGDAVLIARFCAEDPSVKISTAGQRNADFDGDGRITLDDMNALLRRIAKIA